MEAFASNRQILSYTGINLLVDHAIDNIRFCVAKNDSEKHILVFGILKSYFVMSKKKASFHMQTGYILHITLGQLLVALCVFKWSFLLMAFIHDRAPHAYIDHAMLKWIF